MNSVSSARTNYFYFTIKKLFIKYLFEFIAIVLGITLSFYLEDYRQKQELKSLSVDLKNNLLSEIIEIEKYMIERELAFKGDGKLLQALQNPEVPLDSLYNLQTKPLLYGAALFNYRGFMPPVAFYNSLVNDGKIRYLESSVIKQELDLMHNVYFSYIDANVKDEAVAQRKVMDYFQIHYPKLFIGSKNFESDKTYISQIKKTIDSDLTLRAILKQKSLAISQKIVGFNRYNESLQKLKQKLSEDF